MKAHVYNPLHNIELKFDGRTFAIPKGLSVIEDQTFTGPDEYLRNRASATVEDKKAMLSHGMDGIRFATMILNRQYQNLIDAGFFVGEKPPTDEQKAVCAAKCRQYKLWQIEEALSERRERQAGGKGRLKFDDFLIEWMVELGIKDDLYNPMPQQVAAFSESQLAAIGAVAGAAVAKVLETAGAKK